jgi:hypothetical protein
MRRACIAFSTRTPVRAKRLSTRRRAQRAVTARRQARCVCGEATDDPAAAERDAGAERPHFGAANLYDRQRVARAQHWHRPDGGRCCCCRWGSGRGRRWASAATDCRHGAAARRRELGFVALETLQRFGAAGLHARAMGHEIGPARGADRGFLLCRWGRRCGGRGGGRGRGRRYAGAHRLRWLWLDRLFHGRHLPLGGCRGGGRRRRRQGLHRGMARR